MRWRDSRSAASKGSIALSLLALFLLSTHAVAQDSSLSGLPALKSLTSLGGGSSTSSSDDSSTSSAASSSNTDKATTSSDSSSSATSSGKASTITGVSQSLTGGISVSSSSSSSATGSIFHLSDLPTVAGATIPTQTVPNTANAPFMQKSSLPEGSVFIIVGAILGFFGACVLAWRALVAWSLSRSVKRAAIAHHQTFDLKSGGAPGFYSQKHKSLSGSTEALTQLTAQPNKSSKRGSQRPKSSGGAQPMSALNTRASTQNLFFSPTAGAGHHSQLPSPHLAAGNRSSSYLPAGYYASGSSQPAGGQPTTHINAHAAAGANPNRGSSILNPLSDRLSGLRAESAGYQRTQSFGPSPPGSPGLAPSATPASGFSDRASRTLSPGNASSVVGQVSGPTGGLYAQPSSSTLNLSVPGGTAQPGGRTPSAYLEDLFENHGNGPRERF